MTNPETIMSSVIPIFPLPMVLFPGEVRALRIFEPRYRAMLQDCLSDNQPFGIVLAGQADPQAGEAIPHNLGTLAHIDRVENLPDGTFGIGIHGGERFRILDFHYDKLYLQGVVTEEQLQHADAAIVMELNTRMRQVLPEYVSALTRASGFRFGVDTLPDEPAQLAYLSAMVLQINNEEKQSLLAIDSLPELMVRELNLLAVELNLMAWINETIVATQEVGFGSNGWMNLN